MVSNSSRKQNKIHTLININIYEKVLEDTSLQIEDGLINKQIILINPTWEGGG